MKTRVSVALAAELVVLRTAALGNEATGHQRRRVGAAQTSGRCLSPWALEAGSPRLGACRLVSGGDGRVLARGPFPAMPSPAVRVGAPGVTGALPSHSPTS